jgi:molybdenum cofactor cytidylyltransferase
MPCRPRLRYRRPVSQEPKDAAPVQQGQGADRAAPEPGLRLGAIVLAAGAGARFSPVPGAKLLADLRGRPVLQHVLDAARACRPVTTVVVLGHGREALQHAIEWSNEVRVVNPAPSRGLSSSLQVGLAALTEARAPVDGAFIVLGDQPMLRPHVMRALAAAALSSRGRGRGIVAVVPRYEGEIVPSVRNPVLVLAAGFRLIRTLEGDRGLGSVLEGMGGQVIEVQVPGTHPDVDTPEDLAALRG